MDSSGLQYRHTLFSLSVTAYITPSANPAIFGESNAAGVMARIRGCLMRPRQQLTWTVGGVTYLSSPAPNASCDAAYGPIPKHCDVVEVIGSGCFMCTFNIETALYECCSSTANTPGDTTGIPAWTTHTFSESFTIDGKFLTHRTRSGTLTVRADAGVSPDAFRTVVIAPVPRGFKRTSSRYTIQEDQLAMSYEFIDEEVYKVAPPPALTFSGERRASSNNTGTLWTQEVRIRVQGAKTTPKAQLIQAAYTMAVGAVSPINNFQAQNSKGRLLSGSIADGLDDNWVEIVLRSINLKLSQSFYGLNPAGGFQVDLDHYPGEDATQTAPDPGTLATGLLIALAPVLDDPCLQSTLQAAGGAELNAFPGPGSNPPATIQAVPLVPTETNTLKAGELNSGIYTDYQIWTSYDTDYHTIQLPTVGSSVAALGVLAPPTTTKTCWWTASKVDTPPTIPDPNVIDPNSTLLSSTVIPAAPQLMADATTPVWTVSGIYTYACPDPSQVQVAAGLLPYIDSQYQNTVITTFSGGIIDSGSTSTLQTGTTL